MKGFTLIEVLLAITLIGAIAGFSLPVYQAMQTQNDLDIAATSVVQTVRRAQSLAQAIDGDTSWGVSIQSGSITLFKGTSFAGRDSAFDEIFDMPVNIAVSGVTEIVLAKFTGAPQTAGTITLTSATNETRTITINAKGTANY